MVRKKEIYGVGIVALVCFLLIAFCQKDTTPIHSPKHVAFQAIEIEESITNEYISMEEILKIQKSRIRHEFYGYKFPSNKSMADLVLALGGQPLRTVIITTWRSGSTFLGDIINSLPGNYYHYEPLLDYGIVQIRGPPHEESALKVLKSLLNCDYTDLHRYLEFGMTHSYLFTHNKRLWGQCEAHPDYCWEPDFLNQFCKLFPFQSMKTVRLRLKLAEELLEDESLNVKVILLVRDPRGTLQSRKHRDWCPGEPDCDQPSYLCSDMVSDYSAAIRLKKLYPLRFRELMKTSTYLLKYRKLDVLTRINHYKTYSRALRYEDLSLNPYQITQDVLNFMGLNFHPLVKDFLDSHTIVNVGGVSSTYRNSKNAPFHWRSDLNYTEVQYIEDTCSEAMKLWGYLKTNSSNLKDFYPLAAYDIM